VTAPYNRIDAGGIRGSVRRASGLVLVGNPVLVQEPASGTSAHLDLPNIVMTRGRLHV
jgi:hypothetical protein